MNKHTPGPWTLTRFTRNGKPEKYQTVISQYNHVSRVFDVPPGAPTLCTGDANARLIAAAPDLLHVLEILVEQGFYPHGSTLAAAQKAIAKAKGES